MTIYERPATTIHNNWIKFRNSVFAGIPVTDEDCWDLQTGFYTGYLEGMTELADIILDNNDTEKIQKRISELTEEVDYKIKELIKNAG